MAIMQAVAANTVGTCY